MKKINIPVACATLMMCVLLDVSAQSIDQKKMNKDIEIAEDILMSMMKQDKETMFDLASEPKGMYVPDYGVIFNISGSASPFRVMEHWGNVHEFGDMDFDFNFSDSFVVDTEELHRKAQVLADRAQKMAIIHQHQGLEAQLHVKEMEKEARKAEREHRKNRDTDSDEEVEVEEGVQVIMSPNPNPNANPKIHRTMSIHGGLRQTQELDSVSFRALMMEFLIDYSGLIGQLKPDQKIMVTSKIGGRRQFGRSYYNGKLTAEVTQKDLEAYRKDKLSRGQLIDKIKIDKTTDSKVKDLELFSTILSRIYDHDLAETYYVSRNVSYEKLTNFGVIYSMKMYSSKEHNNRFSMPTQNLNDLTLEQRNKKVEALYPQFEEELKRNILDYGKTIKSLKPNETILFQVKLTECIKCNMPESIEVSVKQSVLVDYDSDKLSKSAALAKINIKKNIK
ncbi:MAG: hypothetical protein ACJA2S_000785 [Cyclobacteriaceae bacterium]|jgi:hypothetical protein